MRVVVCTKYGSPDFLQLREAPKPTPKDNEVLVKVYATTVTSGDWRIRSLIIPRGFGFMSRLIFGFSKPRQPILGSELAGKIEAVGKAVTAFKVGDEIFGFTGARLGCYAEYKCLRDNEAVALKPKNLSYDEAAPLSFGATTALSFLRRGKVQKGDKLLINGASGGVGTAAVQLAKHFGAEVTAVCSGANFELVRSLGADKVIDYTKEDFTRNGETYDLIMDTAGTAPFSRSQGSLKERGRLLLVLGDLPATLQMLWVAMTNKKRIVAGPVGESAEDLRFLAKLAESGAFKPPIDKKFAFEQIAEAHRLVDTGHKRGNVVITVNR